VPETKKLRMRVIPESAQGPRFMLIKDPHPGPLMQGHWDDRGPIDYTCGGCGATLLRTINYKQVQPVVFKCRCGAFNEMRGTHHHAY
jgi:hypothetical protein